MRPEIRPAATALAAAPASIRLLLREIYRVKGLMPLLVRPRGNRPWSPDERAGLRAHLRRLTAISPLLLVLALPGSFLVLPVYWWLHRRRKPERGPQTQEE